MGRQSTNASREVRHAAIIQLQRLLLGPHIVFDDQDHDQIEEIFNRVVFPLVDELLKPQVFLRDVRGMPETRLRASALLCKAFMHFEVRENRSQVDIRLLWVQVLDLLDRLMNIDKKEQLVSLHKSFLKLSPDISAVRGRSRIVEERDPRNECGRHPGATTTG